MAPIRAPGLPGVIKVSDRGRAQSGYDIRLERPEHCGRAGEVRRHVVKRSRGWPGPVTDKAAVVEVAFEDGQRCPLELAREVGRHAPVGPGRAVELVCVKVEHAL